MKSRRIIAAIVSLALGAGMATLGQAAEGPDFRSKEAGKRSSATVFWFYGSSTVREGGRLLHEGAFVRAAKVTEAALAFNLTRTDEWLARNILCIAYVRANAALLALDHCDKAVEMRGDSWHAYNNRANAELALARYDAAIADYEKALTLAEKAEKARSRRREAAAARNGDATTPAEKPEAELLGILQEAEIENPAAVVRENLDIARTMLAEADRL